jgi:hypothetical protein
VIVRRYDSEDPTWSGIGTRPAKRQAYSADSAAGSADGTAGSASGESDSTADGAERRWAALIGSARSRVAAAHEMAAAPQQPQAPASGVPSGHGC